MFDGINLQSSVYSLIVFLSIIFFFKYSLFIVILIICLINFCYLNHKNKSFLGDSGTLLTGFIISYIFIKLYNSKVITSADEIVIFMIIPGIDLLRLFIIRIYKKRNPLSSDRLHLHHLLLDKLGYTKTLTFIITLILIPIISVKFFSLSNFIVLNVTILFYFILLKTKKLFF